jgi:ribosomal protein S18 acetylase RimI-like enzyme
VEIRSARAEDLDDVVSLWRREGGPTSLPGGRAEAEALVRRDPDALLVARDGPALVGTLIVGWDGWRCHLYRMVVEPRCRRQGVAASLVADAKRRARALGARKIDATVAFDNPSAIAFWERQAFEQDPRDGRWTNRL